MGSLLSRYVPQTWGVRETSTDVGQGHQLLDHARASPNAQKCRRLGPRPHPMLTGLCFDALFPAQKPLLPVTVQDQIRLWELEKNRVKSQEGERPAI